MNLSPTLLFVILGIVAVLFVITFIFLTKYNQNKKSIQVEEDVERIIDSFGGMNNILDAQINNSRLKVKLKDISLLQEEKLQNISNQGIFVTEDVVQIILKDNKELMGRFVSTIK